MVKILLADPQDIVFYGLLQIVEAHPSYSIISRVKTKAEIFKELSAELADILILDDAGLIDFSETDCRLLMEQYPELKVFILSNQQDRNQSLSMIRSGVHAYLTKYCSSKEILYGLEMVQEGQKFFCNTVLDLLTNKNFENDHHEFTHINFSTREFQIIELIAQDLSTQEIADTLSLSPHTIHAHRKKILKKLNVSSPVGLLKRALGQGILQVKAGKILLHEAYQGRETSA